MVDWDIDGTITWKKENLVKEVIWVETMWQSPS